MRRVVVCLSLLFTLAIAAVPCAYASGFGVGDPGCQPGDPALTSNVFPVPLFYETGTSNIFFFCNKLPNGQTLFSLGATINSPGPVSIGDIICTAPGVFMTCDETQLTLTSVALFLHGGPGVPNSNSAECEGEGGDSTVLPISQDEGEGCGRFFVNLNCPAGVACTNWLDGTRFDLVANVPEPATAFMLGAGVFAVIRRRYGKRK